MPRLPKRKNSADPRVEVESVLQSQAGPPVKDGLDVNELGLLPEALTDKTKRILSVGNKGGAAPGPVRTGMLSDSLKNPELLPVKRRRYG